MRFEYADISLLGAREENQDRVAVVATEHSALLVVVDGMGGHADGARAAQLALTTIVEAFSQSTVPLLDPLGFLHLTIGRAHEEVVRLGTALPLEQRPRATCALCLVQQQASWWAHVGDSRLYHTRRGTLVGRSRDHSHVELLLREGLINADQAQNHPMRNYVECCLGGDPILPDMSITARRPLAAQDVLLVCSDGFWGTLKDEEIAAGFNGTGPLREKLQALGERAVRRGGKGSDNTSAAALRWLGE